MADVSGSNILVHDELGGVQANLNAKASEIMEQLNQLRAKLQPLIDTWRGQGSIRYQDYMLEWDTAAIRLFGTNAQGGLLGDIAQAMGVNYQNYVEAEEANIRTWGGRAG